MRLRLWQKGPCIVALLLASPALLLAVTDQGQVGPPRPASGNLPAQASNLLGEIRAQAVSVHYLADELEMCEHDPLISWEADASILTRLRDRVNAMDKTLYTLRTIQEEAAPWQQKVIARVTPKAYEITSYVDDAMQNLNDNHETVHFPDKSYAEDADGIYQRAAFIARSIANYEKYAAARTEIQHLSPKLGIKAAS